MHPSPFPHLHLPNPFRAATRTARRRWRRWRLRRRQSRACASPHAQTRLISRRRRRSGERQGSAAGGGGGGGALSGKSRDVWGVHAPGLRIGSALAALMPRCAGLAGWTPRRAPSPPPPPPSLPVQQCFAPAGGARRRTKKTCCSGSTRWGGRAGRRAGRRRRGFCLVCKAEGAGALTTPPRADTSTASRWYYHSQQRHATWTHAS